MAYNPKNPPGKNSQESMALFGGYSAEAFKAAKNMDVSADTLGLLMKNATQLTEDARRKIVLSSGNIKAMAKSIAAMNVAAQTLRSNPKDLASVVALSRSMASVSAFRKVLGASGVSMPGALSRADFAARGHINQFTQGKPVAPILDKILKANQEETKLREKEANGGGGYGTHLQKLLSKNAGKSGFFSNMVSGGLGGVQGLAGRAIMSMGPVGMALGAAAVTAGAIVTGISKLQDLQKDLVNKAQPYTDYMQNVAQVSRYGGGRGMMNMPFEMRAMAGQATEQGNLSTLLPSFSATNGISPAMMSAMAATGVPIRNLSEGRRVLRTIYGEQASGGPMGGLGIDQLTGMTKQLYGLGMASRGGGNMVNTQAASVTNSIYANALQTGIAEGFDKSSVAQAIQDSLDTMAKQGGVSGGMPAGLFSLFGGQRGMTPGVAASGSMVSSLQGLTEAGGNIVQRPGLMVGLQNYVMGHFKGGSLSSKLMGMGAHNSQIGAFTKRFGSAIHQNPSLALASMAEAGLLTDLLPASLNSMFGGGKGGTSDLFRAFAAKGSLGQSFSQGLALSNVHGRISGAAGGLDDHSREMMRLRGLLDKNPVLQTYMRMLQTNPAAADNLMRLKGGSKLFKSFFGSPVFGSTTNPMFATLGGNQYHALDSKTMMSQPTAAGLAVRGIFGAIGATTRRNASMMADQAQSNLSVEEQRGQAGTLTDANLATGEGNVASAQGLDAVTAQNWLTATRPMVNLLSQINNGIQALVQKVQ